MGEKILNHLGLKLISLCLACLVWFYVTNRKETEITFSLPFRLESIPQNKEISWQSDEYANVRVRGSPLEMRGLTPQQIQVYLDLAGAQVGDNIYYLSAQNVRLPKGLEVAHTIPSHVTLRVEKSLIKQVLVRPNLTGELMSGYNLKKVEISPPTVEIKGGSSAVEAIGHVETYPIDLSGIKEDTTRVIFLRPPDEPVRFLQVIFVNVNILLENPQEQEVTENVQPESTNQ